MGDLQGMKIDFSEIEDPKVTIIKYSTREHNIEICSNTLAFNHKNLVALLTANPTQNKDIGENLFFLFVLYFAFYMHTNK